MHIDRRVPSLVRGAAAACVTIILSAGCSASTEKPAVDAVLSSPPTRAESFEATLRVLDQHPEYVDEFFQAALRHPETLNRLLEANAKQLADDRFARQTAAHLAAHPAGLHQTMLKTLDAVSDKPPAMSAISKAMSERPEVAAMIVTQRQDTVRVTLTALVQQVQKNDEARRAFLQGMHDNSDALARILAANPKVLGQLMKSLSAVGADKGKAELAAFVKALGPSD